jgi:dihydrofolate reductase
MAKLTLWMQMSLDGYAEGPDHAFDWPLVGPRLQRAFFDELRHADAFVYGRHIYEMMAAVWPAVDANPGAPAEAREFARVWLPMAKYVFSQTLTDPGWNTTVVRDDVATAIRGLVARSRHGVVAFGGPRFAATLMRLGLVDDYQLFVHPVVLGDGTPLFAGITDRHQLRLVTSRTYDDTVVAIRYASAAPRGS